MRYTPQERKAPAAKYRPVLTAAQITHILALAKKEVPLSDASASVIAVLAPFQAKIQNSGVSPAYETTQRPSTLESLGGTAAPPKISLSKEERWRLAYLHYSQSPETCTLQEIIDAKEHMYLHDLMSPEEMVEFESGIGIGDL